MSLKQLKPGEAVRVRDPQTGEWVDCRVSAHDRYQISVFLPNGEEHVIMYRNTNPHEDAGR